MSDYDWTQDEPPEDGPREYGPERDPWQVYPKELAQNRAAARAAKRDGQ
ncbi:hypothetical protein [Streptosporangium sp. NBC_01469]|nr:hypothetical protein [Streptosporangium sp. NBC_01469]